MVKSERIYHVVNTTKATPLGSRIRVAGTSRERREGLLGLNSLDDGGGLWINPCEAIHTFGMRMAIDVMFLDKHLRVRKQKRAIPARRIAVCLSANSVLELPAGTIERSRTEIGDVLEVAEAQE